MFNNCKRSLVVPVRIVVVLMVLIALFSGQSFGQVMESNGLNWHSIRGLNLTIGVPPEMDVITRDLEEKDPVFSKLGLTKAEALEEMIATDMYVQIIPGQEPISGISIMMIEDETTHAVWNYNLNTREFLEDKLGAIVEDLRKDDQISDLGAYVYEIGNMKYMIMNYVLTDEEYAKAGIDKIHILQATTVINGQQITFSLKGFNSPVEKDIMEQFRAIIDGAIFAEIEHVEEAVGDGLSEDSLSEQVFAEGESQEGKDGEPITADRQDTGKLDLEALGALVVGLLSIGYLVYLFKKRKRRA